MKRTGVTIAIASLLVACEARPPAPTARAEQDLWTKAASVKHTTRVGYLYRYGTRVMSSLWDYPDSGLYDPATDAWTAGPQFRYGLPLADGDLFGVGGAGVGGLGRLSPATGGWTAIALPPGATGVVPLCLLSSGRVLVAVTTASSTTFGTFQPSTGSWSVGKTTTSAPPPDLFGNPVPSGAVPLPADRAYLTATNEIYDATKDTKKTASPGATGVVVPLPSGKLFSAGTSTAQIFDPTTDSWATVAPPPSPVYNDVIAFGADRVLAAGGYRSAAYLTLTQVYRLSTNTWTRVGDLAYGRMNAGLATLADGRVMLAGGENGVGDGTDKVEIFGTLDGQACTDRLDCVSDQCVDGVCCATACAADEICNSATAKGVCKKKNGVACTSSTQCGSGQCVDGVCCNVACGGQCQACDVAGSVGTCTAVKGAPHGSRTACGGTGAGTTCGALCDGATVDKCTFPGATTPCGTSSCVDGVETLASSCDGAGKCGAAPKSCGDYVCDADRCKTACAAKADCAAGRRCDAGKCIPIEGLGKTCATAGECSSGFCTDGVCCEVATCGAGASCAAGKGVCKSLAGTACGAATAAGADAQCASGHCVDGVCCNEACADQCAACNEPGKAGTCTPVVGPPRGARPACDAPAGDVCAARTCNGAVDTKTCAGFKAAAGTACAAPSCAGATFTGASSCAAGKCAAPASISCAPYACDAEGCKSSCATPTDCAPGHTCEAGRCRPKQARCTADKSTAIDEADKETPCAPFLCRADGRCADTCGISSDCAIGFVCDQDAKKCVAPAAADEGGCTTGRGAGSGPGGAALGLALVLLGRGRRRR